MAHTSLNGSLWFLRGLHVHSYLSKEMWTIFKLNDPLFSLNPTSSLLKVLTRCSLLSHYTPSLRAHIQNRGFSFHVHFMDPFPPFRISSAPQIHRHLTGAPPSSQGFSEAPAMSLATDSRHSHQPHDTKGTFLHCMPSPSNGPSIKISALNPLFLSAPFLVFFPILSILLP